MSTTYALNAADEVRLYRVEQFTGELSLDGSYQQRSLQKVTTTDEDGHAVETFTDNADKTILTCRPIQTVSDNQHGTLSMVCTTYDFMGNVLKQREAHGNDVLETTNTYDDRSRLLTATYKLNNGTLATVTYTYDNVGRLVTKKYGDNITEQMAYNIRGWLTSKESNVFKMQLHYENPQAGATACYNGNISEWSWQQGSNPQQLYAFAYDNVNRLQQTVHKVKSDSSWIANNSHYEEKGSPTTATAIS